MKAENPEDNYVALKFFSYLGVSICWHLVPIGILLMPAPLRNQYSIPLIIICVVYVAANIARVYFQYRKTWQNVENEKREMQKRFEVEDTALFSAAKQPK